MRPDCLLRWEVSEGARQVAPPPVPDAGPVGVAPKPSLSLCNNLKPLRAERTASRLHRAGSASQRIHRPLHKQLRLLIGCQRSEQGDLSPLWASVCAGPCERGCCPCPRQVSPELEAKAESREGASPEPDHPLTGPLQRRPAATRPAAGWRPPSAAPVAPAGGQEHARTFAPSRRAALFRARRLQPKGAPQAQKRAQPRARAPARPTG